MTRVKSVPVLPCWTWTVFLIFMFWSGALVCLILQNHWWLNQIAISPKSLFFGVFSALCFRQYSHDLRVFSPASSMGFPLPHETVFS
jgi:hypothetical protein